MVQKQQPWSRAAVPNAAREIHLTFPRQQVHLLHLCVETWMAQQTASGHSRPNYKMENPVLGIVTNLALISSVGQHIINILRSSPLNLTYFGTESLEFIYHVPTWQLQLLSIRSSWLHHYTCSEKTRSILLRDISCNLI